jgi:hypothetical protein
MILLVYLADVVRGVSVVFGLLALFTIVMMWLYVLVQGKPPNNWGRYLLVAAISALVSALLPSKQGVYQVMAAYGAVETVQYLKQNDDANRIAGKSIQAIEKMLDDAIKEDKK